MNKTQGGLLAELDAAIKSLDSVLKKFDKTTDPSQREKLLVGIKFRQSKVQEILTAINVLR